MYHRPALSQLLSRKGFCRHAASQSSHRPMQVSPKCDSALLPILTKNNYLTLVNTKCLVSFRYILKSLAAHRTRENPILHWMPVTTRDQADAEGLSDEDLVSLEKITPSDRGAVGVGPGTEPQAAESYPLFCLSDNIPRKSVQQRSKSNSQRTHVRLRFRAPQKHRRRKRNR